MHFNIIVFTTFLFIFGCNELASGNNPNIDSLEIAINNAKVDTIQLNRLLKELNSNALKNTPKTDSLAHIILNRFLSIKYSEGVYNTIDFLASLNYKRGNFKEALKYHRDLLNLLQKEDPNSTRIAGVYKFLTGEYFNMGSFDSAIIYGERAIAEFENLADSQNLARSLNLLGGIYWNKGNLKKASEKLYEGLKIREKLKDTIGLANAYNNIGLIFDSQGKLTEATEMYYKALDLFNKINHPRGIGQAYNNIAIVKKIQGKYSESLEMFLKSQEIDRKLENIDDLGKTLNNIGLLYLELKDIEKGTNYFNQAYDAFKQSGNDNGIAAVYINLGKASYFKKDFSNAQKYYSKGLDIANKIGSSEWRRDSYNGLYKTAKVFHKNGEALSYYEKYKILDDSLRSIENMNKLDLLKIEFETDQKDKEIALLSKDNELSALKFKKQKTYTHLLLTIITSSAIIILLISLYVHRLKTAKSLLLLKNAEITQQKEEILAQRDMLEESNVELTQQQEELLTQADQIEKQSNFISGINRRMTEGLEYASLIQQTLMPNTSIFEKYFKSQFVIFKPKDIVSGDLYWLWEEKDELIFTIADCTGHGVAGAFMSVMAISLLKDAVGVNKLTEPNQISNYLYQEFIKSSNSELNSIVGIDFIVCKYSPKQKTLTYCGNHMNFIIGKRGHIDFIKVGKMFNAESSSPSFTNNTIDLESNDRLYFYTDGYTDQLSGVRRKKMGRTEFQKLIATIEIQPHTLQPEMIEEFYQKWKGNFEQVDDVLILGLEV